MNKLRAKVKSENEKVRNIGRVLIFAFCLLTFLFTVGCRYDMQDQPRLKPYKSSEFFNDEKAMRDFPDGTVARGQLKNDKAFYTGKKENTDPNVQVETTTDSTGNTLVSSFPNDVEELPIPVTKELLDRGESRYNIYCSVCHGPVGKGDGMVVRRGYPQPPTYHDDRLRNAPVGHFFDVITNGWGKMNNYASQIPVADRWAIVAYIRALQLSQNPDGSDDTDSATANDSTKTEENATDNETKTDESSAQSSDNGGNE